MALRFFFIEKGPVKVNLWVQSFPKQRENKTKNSHQRENSDLFFFWGGDCENKRSGRPKQTEPKKPVEETVITTKRCNSADTFLTTYWGRLCPNNQQKDISTNKPAACTTFPVVSL